MTDLNDAAGTLDVTRGKLTYKMTKISPKDGDNAVAIAGADLCAGDLYAVAFTARAGKDLACTFVFQQANGKTAEISEPFQLTSGEEAYSFTTKAPLSSGGLYDLLWQFGSTDKQKLGSADVEISNIPVYSPAETLKVTHSAQNVTVNGKTAKPDAYSINSTNYCKLRDLAVLLNNTDTQSVVRQNRNTNTLSLTTGKAYVPLGGELTIGADRSASCVRNARSVTVNGKPVRLKAYTIGGDVYFRLIDLDDLLGFKVAEGGTTAITSPLTPEAQEKAHVYDLFFLPEVDGDSQACAGDTMPLYDNGVYYCDFPSAHWTRIRTNNAIERLNREIRRRTRVVGAFPDGNSALMLVCARLRHVAGTQWGNKKYMNMKHLEAALGGADLAG